MTNEMQPDEWPKYRYLLLEIWEPTDEKLSALVKADLKICRAAVMRSAFKRALNAFCLEHVIPERNVTHEQREEVLTSVVATYDKFLSNVRRKAVDLSSIAAGLKGELNVLSASDEPVVVTEG
jgi:hypothetical protein